MGRIKIYLKAMCVAAGIMVLSQTAFAQRQTTSMGIRAGSNWTASAGDRDIFGNDNLRGYSLGAYAIINVSDFFGIQPEILFSRRSYFAPRGNYVYPGTEEVFPFYMHSFDYLDIPLFMRFNITRGFHVLAGPQISNPLGSRERYIGFGGREFLQIYQPGSFMDLAGVVGVAYEFPGGLNLGIRYGYGLGRIHTLTNFEGGNIPHQTQGLFTIGHTFGGNGRFRRDTYMEEE